MLIRAEHLWWNHQHHTDMLVELHNERVISIRTFDNSIADFIVHLIAPLLTDLQVNGGGGILVNNNPTPSGLQGVAAAHRQLGTGTILPTVITDTFEVMEAACEAALSVMHKPGIGGLHIEGPHLAVERRGTHLAKHIRPLDKQTVVLVERMRSRGLPLMITLAPEHAELDLLQRLAHSGAVVSGGHSAATLTQTQLALDNGLSCFTHLYNAMPPMSSRVPGILGAALDSHAHAGIIVDGIHVSWEMVRIALRARPSKNLCFAVSDAMATVGGPDHFTLYGQDIRVQDGALINAEGALAGAHIDLLTSLCNLVHSVALPYSEALPMVTDIPRSLMKLPPAFVDVGTPLSDLLIIDDAFKIVTIH